MDAEVVEAFLYALSTINLCQKSIIFLFSLFIVGIFSAQCFGLAWSTLKACLFGCWGRSLLPPFLAGLVAEE